MAASLRSQLAWYGRREGRRARRGLGMVSWPPTMAAVVASTRRGPRRRCHAAEERKRDMTSRVGRLSSLIQEGRKREGKGGPRPEGTKFEEGAGGSRGRSECEEAITTRPAGAKKRGKASAASESARAIDRSGAPRGPRMAGRAKIFDKAPSPEALPGLDRSPLRVPGRACGRGSTAPTGTALPATGA